MRFSEIAQYRGAIFVPWSPETYAFRELTAMAMPTFVPAATWLLRCAMSHYTRASRALATRWGQVEAFAAAHGDDSVPPSLALTEGGRFWLSRTDYAAVPGIVYFDSVPDLVRRLSEPSHVGGLRAYVRRGILDAHSFWASVLTALVKHESLSVSDGS